MQVREYLLGDEREILSLFNIVFERQLDPRYWQWRFIESPFGHGIVRLMFDDEKLVGHYAVVPTELWVKGDVHKAAFSMTTMTHPDYGGRGIFTELASEVYRCCKENGIKVIFGFPNENSYHGFTSRLDWTGHGHVRGWSVTSMSKDIPDQREFTCEELPIPDGRVDDLWIRARNIDTVMVPRTAEFVDWRYFRKPGNEYHVYGIKDRYDVLQGLLVLKTFICEGKTTGHIIDVLTTPGPETQRAVLAQAARYFGERNITNITCWVSTKAPVAPYLHVLGFSPLEWPTYFGTKVFDDEFSGAEFVRDTDRWSFTMGDSDVF